MAGSGPGGAIACTQKVSGSISSEKGSWVEDDVKDSSQVAGVSLGRQCGQGHRVTFLWQFHMLSS